jgi:uncharacterized protein YjbI with pentapeptide repeats
MDAERLVRDFRALYPEELLERYAAGERDFSGINLHRREIEAVAERIPYHYFMQPDGEFETRGGLYPWHFRLSTLWRDRLAGYDTAFYWWGDEFSGQVAELDDEVEIPTANFEGQDLSRINLQGAYIYKATFRGANLSSAQLQGAIFIDVDMEGADLHHSDFREARLAEVNLTNANLYMARGERSNLTNANLSGSNLNRTKLRRANLSMAQLRDAQLRGAYLSRNRMIGTNFRGTDLEGVLLRGAVVSGALIDRDQEAAFLDALEVSRDPNRTRPQVAWF